MAPNGETERQRFNGSEENVRSFLNENRLCLLINDDWYDLTQWKNLHPGGAEILEKMNGKDATDAFYSLHSDEALKRLSKLKPFSKNDFLDDPADKSRSFRQFRKSLIGSGYFERSMFWEIFYHLSPYFLCFLGSWTYFVLQWKLVSIFLIGLGMQQAGWIGHDYAHGRGFWMRWMCRSLSGFINGFSPSWWSEKHNTHHVFTNNLGIDSDISNDPVFHLFFPNKDQDVWFRSYQHIYYLPVYSILYLSWRFQSIQHAVHRRNYRELIFMLPSYIWLWSLGWQIALPSILVGGFLVAAIVTATHQSEHMLIDSNFSFVETQFLTTCDARCDNFFMEWLWGGMQYQLEHHLFPTMPKYNYPKVRPLVERWAKENHLPYKCQTVWSIWYRNFQTMKHFAQ